MKRDPYHSPILIWSLFIFFMLLWFYGLGARTLVPSDESRYAEMAREMLATGDWITPRLNGIKYFEKPPLQTWMNALTFYAFGLGEWQARLWTGLSGLLGIALVAYTGLRVFNAWVGTTAALVLGSCFWWNGLGHVNTLDMGLSAQMTLTLCGLMLAQHNRASPSEQRNWMWACWLGMALATLSKGLIAIVLPGAVLVLYTLITRDWKLWLRLRLFSGLILFFAVAAPWFYLVWKANPEHPQFFFIHEHFDRFIKTGPDSHHREGPIYYYIPMLVIGILPWIGFMLQAFWAARRDTIQGFHPRTMLVIWSGFIFVFFSISGSKLPHYILPIFPAIALLIASYLAFAKRRAWRIGSLAMAFVSILGLMTVAVAPRYLSDPIEHAAMLAASPYAFAAFGVLLAGCVLVLAWSRGPRDALPSRAVIALAASGFLAGQLLLLAYEPFGLDRSGHLLVPAIQANLTPTTKIYQVGMYDQTLPFYLQRTTTLVEHLDELEFGIKQQAEDDTKFGTKLQPEMWIPTREQFLPIWLHGPKAILITRPDLYDQMLKQGFPMRVITRDERRVIASNDIRSVYLYAPIAHAAVAAAWEAINTPAPESEPTDTGATTASTTESELAAPATPAETAAPVAPGSTSPSPNQHKE